MNEDQLPITHEWLETLGFIRDRGDVDDMRKGLLVLHRYFFANNEECWYLNNLDRVGFELRTRRQVVLLMEVFKESLDV